MRLQTITLALLAAVAAGCGDGGSGNSEDGSVTVGVSTSGNDINPYGYAVVLGTRQPFGVGVNDTVELVAAAGEHVLALVNVPDNCNTLGENPRMVVVEAGRSTESEFAVECFIRTGIIQVRTFTSGSGGARDGFIVRIGDITQAVERTGSRAVVVPPGDHQVLLDGITGCTVEGDNPMRAQVAEEEVATVTFVVNC
jgi:hypothetical protein